MKKNMGTSDRIIRVIIAVAILGLYLAGIFTGTWAIVLVALAAVFLLTSMIGFCPLYLPLGIHTCGSKAL